MPWGDSIYHGLATQLTRRFARGFQTTVAYTWSHNIDDSTATHFSTLLSPRRPQDFQNLSAERSNSPLDRRHRLTVNWLWDMPYLSGSSNWAMKNLIGNWRFVGTYTAESGEWVTAQSGGDANLNGDSAPDRTVINPAGDAETGQRGHRADQFRRRHRGVPGRQPRRPLHHRRLRRPRQWRPQHHPACPASTTSIFRSPRSSTSARPGTSNSGRISSNAFNHAQYTAGYINSVRLTSQTTTPHLPAAFQFRLPAVVAELLQQLAHDPAGGEVRLLERSPGARYYRTPHRPQGRWGVRFSDRRYYTTSNPSRDRNVSKGSGRTRRSEFAPERN